MPLVWHSDVILTASFSHVAGMQQQPQQQEEGEASALLCL